MLWTMWTELIGKMGRLFVATGMRARNPVDFAATRDRYGRCWPFIRATRSDGRIVLRVAADRAA
jgi:hypothetical protein